MNEKDEKRIDQMTSEELAEKVFPPPVLERLKELAHERDDAEPPSHLESSE